MHNFLRMAFILIAGCSLMYDTDDLPRGQPPESDSGAQPASDADLEPVIDATPLPGLADAAPIPDTGSEGCGELGDDCENDWVECNGAGQCLACGGSGQACCLSGDACQLLNLTCNLELNQCLL